MFYRETGQFKTSYAADMAIFPIRQDRIALWIFLAIAFIAVPLLDHYRVWPFASEYLLRAMQSLAGAVREAGKRDHLFICSSTTTPTACR